MANIDGPHQPIVIDSEAFSGLCYYLKKAEELDFSQVMTILEQECQENPDFERIWEKAEWLHSQRSHEGHVLTKEHCKAITCYTLVAPNIVKDFNLACRGARNSDESWAAFRFKSLWCLLIDAFKVLPVMSPLPEVFYRGHRQYTHYRGGNPVHFPHFVSAALHPETAMLFSFNGCMLTFDSVPAEFVRDISSYSAVPNHHEVLIWPLCTFVLRDSRTVQTTHYMREPVRSFTFREAEPLRRPMASVAVRCNAPFSLPDLVIDGIVYDVLMGRR